MIFRQILYRDLGCASYFLADEGEAAVVDPRWDIDVYVELAAEEGVRIAHVLDTHRHADHVSGRERLAARTGAQAHAPAASEPAPSEPAPSEPAPVGRSREGAPARAAVDGEDSARAGAELAAGDVIGLGRLRLRAWATPGHRPEHLSIVVSDVSRGDDPWLVLSGDSLLVGDLARPDLAVEASQGARELHRSIAGLLELGDHVELWPAHVGGSLCGGAGLSGKTSSTVGYERTHNPLLGATEDVFVDELLRELPSRPPNIARVVSLNTSRAPAAPQPPTRLDVDGLSGELAAGVRVLDARAPDAFDAAHLAGALNLPPGRAQGTRAGWVIDPDERMVVIGRDEDHARAVASALHAVGLWRVVGVASAEPERWREQGLDVRSVPSWDVAALAERLRDGGAQLVDVREPREWRAGHVPGSLSLPLHRLLDRSALSPSDAVGPLAVACAGGARAAFAASVIRGWGHAEVVRVGGGGIGSLPEHGVELVGGA